MEICATDEHEVIFFRGVGIPPTSMILHPQKVIHSKAQRSACQATFERSSQEAMANTGLFCFCEVELYRDFTYGSFVIFNESFERDLYEVFI